MTRPRSNMRLFLFSCAALCLALLPLRPAHADAFTDTRSITLASGLEVIVVPSHRVPAISHMIVYRVGASDDPRGKSGLAHYLEHMMFQGTPTVPSGEFSKTIQKLGGEHNAFTTRDYTAYMVNIAKEHLPRVMELEADRMQHLAPLPEHFSRELQVILEERGQMLESRPTSVLGEQMDAALFRHHPYGTPIIGWRHEMEGFTSKDALDFKTQYYHPANAFVVIAGDVTLAEAQALAEKYYGAIPAGAAPARIWPQEPPQKTERFLTLRQEGVQEPLWMRSMAVDSLLSGKRERMLPLGLLAQALGGGQTGRLYQSLVVKQKLATSVSAAYNGYNIGPGEFYVQAVPAAGVSQEALAAAVDEEIRRVQKDGVTEEEFSIAQTLFTADLIYAQDGLQGLANVLVLTRALGLPVDYPSRFASEVKAVTREQVKEAASVLLRDHSVTGMLLPAAKENTP